MLSCFLAVEVKVKGSIFCDNLHQKGRKTYVYQKEENKRRLKIKKKKVKK